MFFLFFGILKNIWLFKLRWCGAQDLFGSQIPVTTGGYNCESLTYKLVT